MCPHTTSKARHGPPGHSRSHSRVSDAKPAAASPEVWRDRGFSPWGFPWGTESHTYCSGWALCPAPPPPLPPISVGCVYLKAALWPQMP